MTAQFSFQLNKKIKYLWHISHYFSDPDSAITEEPGPSCTWGSWEEWGPCDCSEGVRRRKMEGFGSGPDCKTKIATSPDCDQECKEVSNNFSLDYKEYILSLIPPKFWIQNDNSFI